jgi:hypothetical protein
MEALAGDGLQWVVSYPSPLFLCAGRRGIFADGKEAIVTTFNLGSVEAYVASLDERMIRCQNGEGLQCATLDAVLKHHANLCCEFIAQVRRWGQAVFAGRESFDPAVEKVWLDEGSRLLARAMELDASGSTAEGACYVLEGQQALDSALLGLIRMLKGWTSPKLAVGPSARGGLAPDQSTTEEVHRRLASLPPLPADWKPDDPKQRAMHRLLKTS